MNNTEPKIVEKEKIVAEKLNGRFAMLGFVALVGAFGSFFMFLINIRLSRLTII